MKARILFSPEAREQARDAARWWRENRPSAPRLFADEIRRALVLIGSAPIIGVRYAHDGVANVRRVLLPTTRFHIYYVHDEAARAVDVVAVWSAVRGRRPPIGR
jgi:plasmid stabilization system protein ParE